VSPTNLGNSSGVDLAKVSSAILFCNFSTDTDVIIQRSRMPLAALSNEAKIANQLDELGCSSNAFAEISGVVGRTRVAQGLAGQKDFEPADADKMLVVLAEMTELRDLSQSPPDWKQTDEIRKALDERRKAKTLTQDVNRFLIEWNKGIQKT
jgi:hypothetical protein